jgi:hypothetical protein
MTYKLNFSGILVSSLLLTFEILIKKRHIFGLVGKASFRLYLIDLFYIKMFTKHNELHA